MIAAIDVSPPVKYPAAYRPYATCVMLLFCSSVAILEPPMTGNRILAANENGGGTDAAPGSSGVCLLEAALHRDRPGTRQSRRVARRTGRGRVVVGREVVELVGDVEHLQRGLPLVVRTFP